MNRDRNMLTLLNSFHQQDEVESKVNQVKTNHAARVIQTQWKKHREEAEKKKEEENIDVGLRSEKCCLDNSCFLPGDNLKSWFCEIGCGFNGQHLVPVDNLKH